MQEAILIYKFFENKQHMIAVRKYYKGKLNEGELTVISYDDEGVLISFNHNNKNYSYRSTFYFNDKDKFNYNVKYYEEIEFKEYNNGSRFLKDVSFFIFEEAKVDDFVTAKVLNPESPYTECYKQTIYDFNVQNENHYYLNHSQFPNPTIGDNIVYRLAYDNNNILQVFHPSGSFYKENFSDYIIGLSISNSQKRIYAQLMTKICWKIGWIKKDILNKIAFDDFSTIENAMRNKILQNDNTAYNLLGTVDKIVGQLLKDWGYFFEDDILASKIFPSTLTGDFLTTYYSNLNNFYNFLEFEDESNLFPKDSQGYPLNKINGVRLTNDINEIKNVESNRRIIHLLSILPSDSMSLFSPELRLEILDKVLNCKQIYEDKSKVITTQDVIIGAVVPGYIFFAEDNTSIFTEKDVLNLISTFNNDYNNANILLDHLLNVKLYDDNQITKFERLYQLINDVRTIAGISVDNENNRYELTKLLHEIWKKSKYCFFSIPPSGLNENGVNPECYFLNDGQNYYNVVYDNDGNVTSGAEPIIEFSPVEKSFGYKQGIDFKPDELDKKIVKVHRYKYGIEYNNFDTHGDGMYQTKEKKLFAEYHLYQTISLQGYKVDEDLQNSNPNIEIANIPSFLFYYYNDYDKIKNLDATISLFIEITLEVGLFFGTGGASAIANIRHLRHISKLRFITKSANAYAVTQEAVLAWKGLQAASETISMGSGVIFSILNYHATVEENAFTRKLSYFFMAFAFASVGTSIFSRRKITKLADEILENIPPGHPLRTPAPGETTSAWDFFNIVKNRQTTLINQTDNLISGLSIPAANKQVILDFFNALTDAEKTAFHFDFKNLVTTDWAKFSDDALQAWKDLRLANIAEATNLNIITKPQKVAAITQFYGNIALRNILEPLPFNKRWRFLDELANVNSPTFQRIQNHTECIEIFLKHNLNAQKLLGQNSELWLKYFESRHLLKNGNYNGVAQLFGSQIGNSDLIQGIRYVTDGAFDINDLNQAIQIANRTDDVLIISNKIGIPFDILNRAKQHYYIDEHLIFINGEFKIGRFEKIFDYNQEWLDMINKNLNDLTNEEIINFKKLIAHEYVEAKLMENGMNFRSYINIDNLNVYDFGAHDVSPRLSDGLYFNIGRLESPPIPNLNNLENLDDIVNWYINFYKL